MAETVTVIAIHPRGHGLSGDGDAHWPIEQAADGVAGVLRERGIEKARVMGYSFGGRIAIPFALRHPDMLEKLVVLSAGFARDGDYPEVRAAFEKMPEMAEIFGAGIAQSPLARRRTARCGTGCITAFAQPVGDHPGCDASYHYRISRRVSACEGIFARLGTRSRSYP